MKMPELPKLPKRYGELPELVLPEVHGMGGNTMVLKPQGVFTADQVRDFALAYGEAVREECAKQWEEAHGFDKFGVASTIRRKEE